MGMRISRNKMFIKMAELAADRSTCTRAKVGAILVRNNRVVSMGYVGSPPGEPHCLDEGCIMGETGGCVRTLHAEANAINFARLYGIDTKFTTLYCTHSPCVKCAEEIIKAGILDVVFLKQYRDTTGIKMLQRAGVSAFSLFQLELHEYE